LLFNLRAEFQRAAGLPDYREPATIRTQVLTCGAILGRSDRRLVVHMGESWSRIENQKPTTCQYLAVANPNFAEVDSGLAMLTPDPLGLTRRASPQSVVSGGQLRNSGLEKTTPVLTGHAQSGNRPSVPNP
jgi:hypothetical protein